MCATKSLRKAKSRLPLWGRCPPKEGGEGKLPASPVAPVAIALTGACAPVAGFFLADAHKVKAVGLCPTTRNPLKRVDLNFTWLTVCPSHSIFHGKDIHYDTQTEKNARPHRRQRGAAHRRGTGALSGPLALRPVFARLLRHRLGRALAGCPQHRPWPGVR